VSGLIKPCGMWGCNYISVVWPSFYMLDLWDKKKEAKDKRKRNFVQDMGPVLISSVEKEWTRRTRLFVTVGSTGMRIAAHSNTRRELHSLGDLDQAGGLFYALDGRYIGLYRLGQSCFLSVVIK
jgi:hypothetical protein